MRTHVLTMLTAGVLLCACSEGYAPGSHDTADAALSDAGVDADASGEDASNEDAGADGDDASSPDAAADTGTDTGADTGADAGPSSCAPNHDGTLTRDEVVFRPGLHATFRVAEDVTVDTHGDEQGDGSRVWDLTEQLPGDHSVLVELRSLDGTWYNTEFPDATYAARLSDTDQQLGVFAAEDDGLYLQGVVTPDDGWARTELSYDPAVEVLAFPMSQGDTWTTDATASGWYSGGYWTAYETYESQVDAHGTLKTPFGDFEVLRVRTDLTRTVGVMVTTQITYSFVSECFGTVATIRSQENEDQAEFTDAAEVRRMAR